LTLWKKRYTHYLLESITQVKLCNFGEKRIPKCPKCGLQGVFIIYSREPPPEKTEKNIFGSKIVDWN